MYRNAIEALIKWKEQKNRKPLVIRGARQVGKTWLMKEFGEKYYENIAYFNFDAQPALGELFATDFDCHRILKGLCIESDIAIDAKNTLIIFDEIQASPDALASLKYFHENASDYDILAAGSLLGVAMHAGFSFPVGKVEFLDLYPLNFVEFLVALKKEKWIQLLSENDWKMISTFKTKFIECLRLYYYIGGMPEAVASYIEKEDLDEVRKIQKNILESYELDFSKHASNSVVPRIRMLWNSLPAQLSKENRKFIYGLIKSGARAREYEIALSWLIDCGLIHRISRIEKPSLPLKSYEDLKSFKVYMVDIGLLAAMSDLDKKTLLDGNEIFSEFKGALTEQYVLQQIITNKTLFPYYWTASRGEAEVDFVVQYKGHVFPIEVKAEENLQSKSLKSYRDKYSSSICIRTSMCDYRDDAWLINLPLYAFSSLESVVEIR